MTIKFFTIVNEESLGAVAAKKTWKYEGSEAISCLILTLKFLQNGATEPTLAEVLIQFASMIEVKSDGRSVFSMSATDLFWLLNLLSAGKIHGFVSDAVGADNQYFTMNLFVPFGRYRYPIPVDRGLGLETAGKNVTVEVTIPADGNKVDGRIMTVVAAIVRGATPPRFIGRLTKNLTPGTGWDNYVNLPTGPDMGLVDTFMFGTTALDAGSTSDVETIEGLAIEKEGEPTLMLETNIEPLRNGLGNLEKAGGAIAVNATYVYIKHDAFDTLEDVLVLDESVRYNIQAGDTNAIRIMSGIVRPQLTV